MTTRRAPSDSAEYSAPDAARAGDGARAGLGGGTTRQEEQSGGTAGQEEGSQAIGRHI